MAAIDPPPDGAMRELLWRVTRLEKTQEDMDAKIDRLVMAAVAAAFSLAIAIILLAMNLVILRGR